MKLPRVSIHVILFAALLASRSAAGADEAESPPKPRDLGPPLVDNVKELKQLGKYAAWLDPKNKQIVLVGETCRAGYGLEFLVTTRQRAYESVIVIDRPPRAEQTYGLRANSGEHAAAGGQAGTPGVL